MSFATVAFAAASSPAMKTTSRSSWADREPLAKVFQPIVLKAFTRRAPGIRFATSSLDELSPRSMTRPTALYGFIASITIFPPNTSAGGSASIFRYGSARRTASPNLAASTTDMAFAFGPIEDTNEANVAGPRELLTATWCPAFANSFAAVPPMCPAPMTPIRIYDTSSRPNTSAGYGFSDGAIRVFCPPETRSGGRGWAGIFLERTGMETPEPPAGKPHSRFGFSQVPRKVRWIVFSNAFGAIGFGYITVFITAYFPEIGVSTQVVGLLLGALGLAMVVSAAPLGVYSDRRGRKGLLLVGSAILPPSILVFAFTTDVRWLVLAAVVAGVGEGAFLSSWNAIIADQTTPEQRGAAFALSFVLNNVFSGIGFALPLSFPFLQARTGIDSHTIHVAALVITDGLGFVTTAFAAGGLYLVRAALMNMSAPIGDSFLMGIVAPEQRGLASAVNSIIWRLPNSVTTVLGGILMAAGYLDVPIFLATAFYLASIASFYAVFRNVRPIG